MYSLLLYHSGWNVSPVFGDSVTQQQWGEGTALNTSQCSIFPTGSRFVLSANLEYLHQQLLCVPCFPNHSFLVGEKENSSWILRKYSCKEIQSLNELLPCASDHPEDTLLQFSPARALSSSQQEQMGGRQAGSVTYSCRLNSALLLGRVGAEDSS